MKSSQEDFSENIKSEVIPRIRKAFSGRTLKAIGELLGYSPAQMTRWNQGVIPRSVDLFRIYKKTGVSIHWLLTGEGPMLVADFPGESLNQNMILQGENRIGCYYLSQLPPEPKADAVAMLETLYKKYTDNPVGLIDIDGEMFVIPMTIPANANEKPVKVKKAK